MIPSMIALKIQNVKNFMNLLLMTDTFDHFTLEDAVIKTFATFNIDGLYDSSFFDSEQDSGDRQSFDSYTPWGLIRHNCTEIIKGKHTPVFMKYVLHGSKKDFSDLPGYADIKALLMIIKYDPNGLTVTTGTSMNTFSLDHGIDDIWDKAVKELLKNKDVAFEEL